MNARRLAFTITTRATATTAALLCTLVAHAQMVEKGPVQSTVEAGVAC